MACTSGLSELFHPAVFRWFDGCFAAPTAAQSRAWPAIRAGRHTLIAAPTGSGKTLAAFLAAIDALVRRGVASELLNATEVVYVSPLKALSNDIERNLRTPLAGIRRALKELGLPDVPIRAAVRTGDTPQSERARMRREPPHIVVTTPESLYILLGSSSGRAMLASTRTVIVDEIHAVAGNKRGAHLALSLERLAALSARPLQRIGLSATQKPIELVARFLTGGNGAGPCEIIDVGHDRARDLALELPGAPLEAVMSAEVWEQVYARLVELIEAHKTTLVFVNTRRMAERIARELTLRLGADRVTAHHGSMAKELRLEAEQRLKEGALSALVATASLELGIDIGDVDLVCQIGAPRTIASFLQRVGRAGHAVSGVAKGRLFPLSRNELVACAALLASVRLGELDALRPPRAPLDVLAQQITAEVAMREWGEAELLRMVRRAWPYRGLTERDFSAVVQMLAVGFTTRRGRRGALVHYDAVHHALRGRRGSALIALTSGGTIPDLADYHVVLEPEDRTIGSLNEDFAIESLPGDVFQLGNGSYRILRVERGTLRVADAEGMLPTIPFWAGEAPARSDELSHAVSRLTADVTRRLEARETREDIVAALIEKLALARPAAEQLIDYLATSFAALGALPDEDTIVLERFFDEAGGMQLVLHSSLGSRINRAWGLALRKRFCRKFNFELQAAATESAIVLSLTTAHSFVLADAARYLNSASVRAVLIQALLTAPMFITRWRWVGGIALALPRFRGGHRVPPQIARMEAEDLVAAVFPDQIACAENLVGDREVPDHPLVNQTLADCLTEAMDICGLERVLARLEAGKIRVVARDLAAPSPLALEALAAKPYAFLDNAPLEERRTQAVMGRRWLDPETAADLGRLDPEAITKVREEAWPEAANADEAHDALVWLGFMTAEEARAGAGFGALLAVLAREGRAARIALADTTLWIAAERLAEFRAIFPSVATEPAIAVPDAYATREWAAEEALAEILRGRLEGLGPATEIALEAPLGCGTAAVRAALLALEHEGSVMRGHFTPGGNREEWCDRRLLARIHRATLGRLRAEIEPVAARDFLRFLAAWQRADEETRMEGPDAVRAIAGQLEGFAAPAAAWETEILPQRIAAYDPAWLDRECLAGRLTWARLEPPHNGRRPAPLSTTPIALFARRTLPFWRVCRSAGEAIHPSASARLVADHIRTSGASFFDEIIAGTRLLRSEAEAALGELAGLGLVTSDSFAGLRALLAPAERRGRGGHLRGIEEAGRWALLSRSQPIPDGAEAIEHVARTLLARYGVVFWRLLEREAAWLPPWRDLLEIFHRLEARGEIRAGRFVAGFSGEQFALPEAVGTLRDVRRRSRSDAWLSLSGADPLNLVGLLTPGKRLAALTGNRLLYRDGVPIASLAGGEIHFDEALAPPLAWQAEKALLRGSEASERAKTPPSEGEKERDDITPPALAVV